MALLNHAEIAEIETGFRVVFHEAYDQAEDPSVKLAMDVASNGSSEDYVLFKDVPVMKEWIDERQYESMKAEKFNIVNKSYENSFKVDRDHLEDDKLGYYVHQAAQMGKEAKLHPGKLCRQALLEGFSATSSFGLCYDGEALFSNSHENSFDNLIGNVPLTATSFFGAWVDFASQTDSSGENREKMPTDIFVGPALYKVAREIIMSSLSESANNAATDNQLQGLVNINLMPNFIGTYVNYWALADLSTAKPLIKQNRRGLNFETDMTDMFKRKEYKWGADYRGAVGYGMFQNIMGANVGA